MKSLKLYRPERGLVGAIESQNFEAFLVLSLPAKLDTCLIVGVRGLGLFILNRQTVLCNIAGTHAKPGPALMALSQTTPQSRS